jgi:hypothetical protein
MEQDNKSMPEYEGLETFQNLARNELDVKKWFDL